MQENNRKILIADAEQGWRELLAYELPNYGYSAITVAINGLEAVKKVSQEIFDLVLMDIRITESELADALITIKNIQPNVKIILMSHDAIEARVRKRMEANVVAFIRKPFEIGFLVKAMDQAFE